MCVLVRARARVYLGTEDIIPSHLQVVNNCRSHRGGHLDLRLELFPRSPGTAGEIVGGSERVKQSRSRDCVRK